MKRLYVRFKIWKLRRKLGIPSGYLIPDGETKMRLGDSRFNEPEERANLEREKTRRAEQKRVPSDG